MCYLEGMNKFEEKRAERRKIILTEAKKLVLERGIYDGAMSELAVRAGISRQQLYNYYKNLDEVLEGIMEELVALRASRTPPRWIRPKISSAMPSSPSRISRPKCMRIFCS